MYMFKGFKFQSKKNAVNEKLNFDRILQHLKLLPTPMFVFICL